MANRKLQVFLSSTYEDLIDDRLAAMQAILAAGHIPAAMEQFSAGDDTALDRITRWIDASDAFILMLGGRYGSIEPTSGKSYVQLEYEYAAKQGKPYFALVIKEQQLDARRNSGRTNVVESENTDGYATFKAAVTAKLCEFWDDKKDIKAAILHKLPEWAETDLVGWVRADQAITPEVANELALLSQENRELRAKTAGPAIYGGLSFHDFCELLEGVKVTVVPDSLKSELGILEAPSVSNLLDLFRIVADAIVVGRHLGFSLGPGADQGLGQLVGHGLLHGTAGETPVSLSETGRSFRNRLRHQDLRLHS